MTCAEAFVLISAASDGALDAQTLATLDAHVAGCANCRARREGLAAIKRALRQPRLRQDALPPALRGRLERLGRRSDGRRRIAVALATVVSIVALVRFVRRDPDLVIVALDGEATCGPVGATRALSAGDRLRANDRVVLSSGSASVRLGRALTTAHAPAEVVVRPSDETAPALRVLEGYVFFDVAPAPEDFRVDTPVGTVVVTGTAFSVDVHEETPRAGDVRALVQVVRGHVKVIGEGRAVEVSQGQTAELARGTGPQLADVRALERALQRERGQTAALRLELERLRTRPIQGDAAASPASAPPDIWQRLGARNRSVAKLMTEIRGPADVATLLALDGARATQLARSHENALTAIRNLERAHRRVERSGRHIRVELEPFAQEGDAVLRKWRQDLSEILPPPARGNYERFQLDELLFVLHAKSFGRHRREIDIQPVDKGDEYLEIRDYAYDGDALVYRDIWNGKTGDFWPLVQHLVE